MLTVLMSWLVIGGASFLFGKAIVDFVYKKNLRCMGRLDSYIVAGIVFLNVYAQLFSVFYKVAGIACTILGLAGILIAVGYGIRYFRRVPRPRLLPGMEKTRMSAGRVILLVVCFVSAALWTTQDPGQYDTGLYHAQAIRWIEEYGVAPGLGNLHMRLAYNSAFMSLQALFSLEWLVGQSLHTLNGFFCLCALLYAFGTVRTLGRETWRTSDLLKCAAVIYVVKSRYSIASPGTDIWAMLLILYICIKWCEFNESGEKETAPWCFVCLVGFYALTVKLSAAAIVILVIYPLCLLIGRKDFRRIVYNGIAAILIVLPFLVRNVMISGYLVYPYAGIDLFPVDWKMNPAVVESDSRYNLTMWARGFTDIESYEKTLPMWLPHWFLHQSTGYRVLLIAGAVCAVVVLYLIWKRLREKQYEQAAILGASLVCLVFWLVTAPLIRYGQVYVFIVMAMALGGWERRFSVRQRDIVSLAGMLFMVLALGLFAGKILEVGDMEAQYWVKQPPYGAWPAVQVRVGDVIIWEPVDSDLIGYPAFPSTPQGGQLDHLELRGGGFEDGFRYTEEEHQYEYIQE